MPKTASLERVQKAEQAIVKAGFTHIKFELEAHLFRNERDWGTTQCARFLKDFVGTEVSKKAVFSRFYNDGSVDSELTITFKAQDAHLITHYMDGFKALGDAVGRGIDIRNAGFHIAVLPVSTYPSSTRNLQPSKVSNFVIEVTKLLPALLFVSSHNFRTRSFQYRKPQVSVQDKYSAIAIRNGVIEYRLFDTCYDKPEAVYEKLEIIAKTLKFYSARKATTKLDKPLSITGDRPYSQIYNNPDLMEALENSIKYVKPSYKTMQLLLKERGVETDPEKLRKQKLKEIASEEVKLQTATALWEKRARVELRQFRVEIKDLKGWKSLDQDDEKAMQFLLDNGFVPRKPTRDMLRSRMAEARPFMGNGYRIAPVEESMRSNIENYITRR